MNRCAGNDLLGALVAMVGVGAHLCTVAKLQRLARFSRRSRDRDWRGERGIFQRPLESEERFSSPRRCSPRGR